MWPRFDPLVWLRRRVRAVLAPLMPVVVVGWIGAAGPCVGMAAAAGEQHTAWTEAPVHASTHAVAPRGDAAAADAADDAARSHGACAHCPGADGALSDAHALCGTLDDVSDAKRKPQVPAPDLGKAALPSRVVDIAPRAAPTAIRPPDLHRRVYPPAVPLNLRHCILIV